MNNVPVHIIEQMSALCLCTLQRHTHGDKCEFSKKTEDTLLHDDIGSLTTSMIISGCGKQTLNSSHPGHQRERGFRGTCVVGIDGHCTVPEAAGGYQRR